MDVFSWEKYLIIFARTSGILTFVPGFGSNPVPVGLRAGLALFITLIVFPYVKVEVRDFSVDLLIEFLIGSFIGFLSKLFFETLHIVANFISLQSGLSHSYAFGVTNSEQNTVFYNFLTLITVFGLFDLGVSHLFIKAVIGSYNTMPSGFIMNLGDCANMISAMVGKSFLTAFKLSSPFIVTNITLLLGGSLLARTMPSFQMFLMLTPVQTLVIIYVFSITIQSIIAKFIIAIKDSILF